VIARLSSSPQTHPKYTWSQGLLKKKGKLVVGLDEDLRQKLIQMVHTSPFGGHSGVEVTYKKLAAWFYRKGMRKGVRNWVRECDICQRCKPLLQPPAGTNSTTSAYPRSRMDGHFNGFH